MTDCLFGRVAMLLFTYDSVIINIYPFSGLSATVGSDFLFKIKTFRIKKCWILCKTIS